MSQPPPPPPREDPRPWPPPGGSSGGHGTPPPGHWQAPRPGYAAPIADGAVASLVLGILGVVLCGPFTGIPAVIMGGKARRAIGYSGGRYGGLGMATAGVVLGWISIAFFLIGVVYAIAVWDDITTDTSTLAWLLAT